MIHGLIMSKLDRDRFEVHVAANRGSRYEHTTAVEELRRIPDVHVRPTSFGPSLNFRSTTERIRDAIVTGPRALASLVGLAVYARRNNVRIVHCTEKPRDSFYGLLIARAVGAKCVIHLHVGVNPDWMLPLTTWAMRHADALIGVSDFIRQTAIEAGFRPERCFSVLNAIDVSLWHPEADGTPIRREFDLDSDAIVVTIISRVYLWKGHRELLQALAQLPSDLNWHLLLVGEDDLRAHPGHTSFIAELHELVIELGIEDRVVFTGFRRDVELIMAATDVFAMPSFEEPFGMVYLEANAMLVPVVALDSGGVGQVVDDDRTGLLCGPQDIEALAANLGRLIADRELREEMGQRGRERIFAAFLPERIARDAGRVYDQILASDLPPLGVITVDGVEDKTVASTAEA